MFNYGSEYISVKASDTFISLSSLYHDIIDPCDHINPADPVMAIKCEFNAKSSKGESYRKIISDLRNIGFKNIAIKEDDIHDGYTKLEFVTNFPKNIEGASPAYIIFSGDEKISQMLVCLRITCVMDVVPVVLGIQKYGIIPKGHSDFHSIIEEWVNGSASEHVKKYGNDYWERYHCYGFQKFVNKLFEFPERLILAQKNIIGQPKTCFDEQCCDKGFGLDPLFVQNRNLPSL